MTDHVLTTHTIREAYVQQQSNFGRMSGKQQTVDVYYAEFDRWLQEITDEAWYEGHREAW